MCFTAHTTLNLTIYFLNILAVCLKDFTFNFPYPKLVKASCSESGFIFAFNSCKSAYMTGIIKLTRQLIFKIKYTFTSTIMVKKIILSINVCFVNFILKALY